MADFKFWQSRTDERVRNSELVNLVLNNRNFVLDGVEVTTSAGLTLAVSIGKIFIDGDIVDVSSNTVTLNGAHGTFDRYDLIVINSSGVISAIAGTPDNPPRTPAYIEEDYVVIGGIIVESNQNVLTSNNIYNIGLENHTLGKINRGSSDPASGAVGELFFNTTSAGTLKYYDGATWQEVGSGTGGGIGSYIGTYTAQTSITFTHNLDDTNPVVQVYDNTNEQVTPDKIDITDNNNVLVEFSSATTGWIRILGGAATGSSGTDKYATSITAQTSVTITHNLATEDVTVQVYDSNKEQITPDKISITDGNNVLLEFSTSFTGRVVIIG